jgi:predicted Zn-dependent peptidase
VPVPTVRFSDERLPNGLRLIVAEDHLVPVAAVNLWYGVGSKHEEEGRTGFAHLFEHVMFEGSAHVAKAEHIATVQAAGGVVNGSTWLDRTNYYETMPSHRVELALWLEADRMATLLDALSQENLDNQREVVKNEKRQSYDNRPYGSWNEKLLADLFPEWHPYHHPTIGSMDDLNAASLDDVKAFFRLHYAPNNCVVTVVGDVDRAQVRAWAEKYFGRIPPNPNLPVHLPDLTLPVSLGGEIREVVPDRVPLPRIYWGMRAPVYGDPRLEALDLAGQILAGGKGSRLHRRLVREDRLAQDAAFFTMPFTGGSVTAGWATARPGVELEALETAYWEELERLTTELVTEDELERAKALTEADELGALMRVDERADRLSMYATLFDRPNLINETLARYLAVTAEDIRDICALVFRPDNRVVLTYVPAAAAAAQEAA